MAKNYFGENSAKKLMSLVKGAINTGVDSCVAKTSIADDLATDDAEKVLSAKQGKALKDSFDKMSDGTTAVGNASKLGGQLPAYYATAEACEAKLDAEKVGAANGVASLGADGLVPSSQLPSYVDDVIEGYLSEGTFYAEEAHTTAITGEAGKIYVDLTTNMSYRWSGSTYILITSADMVELGDDAVTTLWNAATAPEA